MIADQRRGGVPVVDPPRGRRGKPGEGETHGEGDRCSLGREAAVIMHCAVDCRGVTVDRWEQTQILGWEEVWEQI